MQAKHIAPVHTYPGEHVEHTHAPETQPGAWQFDILQVWHIDPVHTYPVAHVRQLKVPEIFWHVRQFVFVDEQCKQTVLPDGFG